MTRKAIKGFANAVVTLIPMFVLLVAAAVLILLTWIGGGSEAGSYAVAVPMVLTLMCLVGCLVWVAAWMMADKWHKTSMVAVLFVCALFFFSAGMLFEATALGRTLFPNREDADYELAVCLSGCLLLALLVLRARLHRRWKQVGGGKC